MKPAFTTPTAIVLVDIQEGFKHPTHWGVGRSTPTFETNITSLLQSARAYNDFQAQSSENSATHPIHIFHVHHHSTSAESMLHPAKKFPGTDISVVAPQDYATPLPNEPIIIKHVNSSFIGTDLEARLRGLGVRQLIIAGLTTDHCVSTTTRMAANLHVLGDEVGPDGDGIILLRDGTATYAKGEFDGETVHAVNLASLDGEFANVLNTHEVIEEVILAKA